MPETNNQNRWRMPSAVQLFHVCWAVLFLSICLYSLKSKQMVAGRLGIVLLMNAVCFLFCMKFRDGVNAAKRFCPVFASVLLIFFFALLLLTGKTMLVFPNSDSGTVWYSVADVVETGMISKEVDEYTFCYSFTHTSNHNYFLIYPNSRFLVAYLLPFCRLVHSCFGVDLRSDIGYFAGAVFNAFSITAAVLFAFLATKKEKGNAAAVLLLIFSFFFVPFYLNVYRVYSDTLSMPYVTLTIWLMFEGDHEVRTRRRLFLRFFAGLSVAIGILLKGNLWVLVVACIIYLLFRKNGWRDKLPEIVSAAFAILLITQIWAIYSEHLPWLDTSESDRYELPAIHWINMASDGTGSFDEQETEYMLSLGSVQERKETAKRLYLEHVRQKGAMGYLQFTVEKLAAAFSEGSYSPYLHRQEGRALGSLVTSEGKYHVLFLVYVWSFLFFLYCAIFVSALINARDRLVRQSFLFHLCMFGLFLFFSFWEIKSRYLLNFTPMFLMMAVFGYDDAVSMVKGRT